MCSHLQTKYQHLHLATLELSIHKWPALAGHSLQVKKLNQMSGKCRSALEAKQREITEIYGRDTHGLCLLLTVFNPLGFKSKQAGPKVQLT